MKLFFLLLLAAAFVGCETVPTNYAKRKGKARVTYYCKGEDKWGSKTASGIRAKIGVTVAACRALPFGTTIRIPYLARIFGHDNFVVQDRGSAVEKRKASKGLYPVIDVYASNRKTMNWLATIMPPILDYDEL